MKNSLKTFLSISVCAVFSVFVLPSALAQLDPIHKAELDQLGSQYVNKANPVDIYEWRERAIAKINTIASTNFRDHTLAGKAFSYLMSKVLSGSEDLSSKQIHSFSIRRVYDALNRITCLKCRITTADSHMVLLEL